MVSADDVHRINVLNFTTGIQAFKQCLEKTKKAGGFVSADLEFSGILGPGCEQVFNKDLGFRYSHIRKGVSQFAVLELGFTFYNPHVATEDPKRQTEFDETSFCFSLTCNDCFHSSPSSLQFLARNGLNFSEHFLHAVGYSRPTATKKPTITIQHPNKKLKMKLNTQRSKAMQPLQKWHCIIPTCIPNDPSPNLYGSTLAALMTEVVSLPFVVHNGLLDLAFFVGSFICPLPEKLPDFVHLLKKTFTGDIYDTKYMASIWKDAPPATFLAALHREILVHKDIPTFKFVPVKYAITSHAPESPEKLEVPCQSFLSYGYCNDMNCAFNHNLDDLIAPLPPSSIPVQATIQVPNPVTVVTTRSGSPYFLNSLADQTNLEELVLPPREESPPPIIDHFRLTPKDEISPSTPEPRTHSEPNTPIQTTVKRPRDLKRSFDDVTSAGTQTPPFHPKDSSQSAEKQVAALHSAGFDSLITGQIFSCLRWALAGTEYRPPPGGSLSLFLAPAQSAIDHAKNRIYTGWDSHLALK